MASEGYTHTCENCKSQITVNTYHYPGGVNDKDECKVKCQSCGAEFSIIIKNIEKASISGATLVS